MKKLSYGLLFSMLVFGSIGCEKECNCVGTGEFEYMVFGHFYGECGGEVCVEIFKLTETQLFEDTTDVYPNSLAPYEGQYVIIADSKFQQVSDLRDAFPEELYAEPQVVIGMPDAGDWGGIYVEMKYKNAPGLTGFWLLDQMESNMPAVYNDFVDLINEKIAQINQ